MVVLLTEEEEDLSFRVRCLCLFFFLVFFFVFFFCFCFCFCFFFFFFFYFCFYWCVPPPPYCCYCCPLAVLSSSALTVMERDENSALFPPPSFLSTEKAKHKKWCVGGLKVLTCNRLGLYYTYKSWLCDFLSSISLRKHWKSSETDSTRRETRHPPPLQPSHGCVISY